MPATGPRVGRVDSFDDARGVGTVVDDENGTAYQFHCTAITDGTRTVPVGTVVTFEIAPSHLGRLEARTVGALPSRAAQPAG